MSYSRELAEAEAEAQRLRDELRDRDARYEEQALILQERMQAAEEEAQARGEKLAAAHRRIAELEAARPAPDPGGPLTLEMSAHPVGGLRSYLIRRVGAEHVYLRGFGNAEQFLRDLIRAHNILHGEDDEDDRAFGVALHEAAGRMYRRQADKAAEGVIWELLNGSPVEEAKRTRVAELIYAEMGAGSLATPGEEAQP